jgi:hypothetical protein
VGLFGLAYPDAETACQGLAGRDPACSVNGLAALDPQHVGPRVDGHEGHVDVWSLVEERHCQLLVEAHATAGIRPVLMNFSCAGFNMKNEDHSVGILRP